ncbi:MAG: DUF3791 domain-containing protein [Lentisphaerae bacterium]|nr:DUF3791 domain-containing protein [Lentisphaerota bacterium]
MEKKTESEEKLLFTSFCIEEYKAQHGLTGEDVVKLFEKYGVTDYLMAGFDVLHTLGRKMILADIDKFIETRRRKK